MIDRATFGRTGHESTKVIFGSAGLGLVDQDRADQVLPILRSYGINHIDTAAAYGDAELRLAPWLAAHRREFFVATKTGERTADAARESLERSLERLGVERVDLIQLHNLVEEEEWNVAHGPGGALEALIEAREQGLVSHIGVTGHGLRTADMHLRSLERFDYDSVLLPYNFPLLQDEGYRSKVEDLLSLCAERRVAVQTIKAVARRRWVAHSEDDNPRGEVLSWYEPLFDPVATSRAVDYVLGQHQLFLVTTSDFRRLPDILAAAEQGLGTPSDEVMTAAVRAQGMRPLFDGRELDRI